MRKSLYWQCTWPVLIGFGIAALTALFVGQQNVRSQRLMSQVTQIRDSLERSLTRLQSRHNRFTDRVQEVLLSNEPDQVATTIQWAANNYPRELEKAVATLNQLISAAFAKTKDPKLSSDLRRIEQSVSRIQESISGTANIFENLVTNQAVPPAPEGTISSLFRTHRRLEASVQIALSTIRRSHGHVFRTNRASNAGFPLAWLPFFFWIPIALWLLSRPIKRIRQLVDPTPTNLLKTQFEKDIAEKFQLLRNQIDHAEKLASDSDTEALRSNQATRRAEHELALLRIYNENLANNLRSAVVVSNLTGKVTSVNRAARHLFAFDDSSPEALDAWPFYEALLTRLPDLPSQLQGIAQSNTLLQTDTLPVQLDHHELLVDLTVVPYQDESGSTRGFLWVSDDVTTSVQMKNQLLASEHLAAVGRMSAQVAHEIRNPLSAIGLNAELLEEEFSQFLPKPQGNEAVLLLRAIEHEIERLTQITESYLTLTKTPKPKYQNCDLNNSVTSLITMIRAELKAKKIQLDLHLKTPAPIAWADPGQVRQVLINTIRNAEEAMPEGGVLSIRTHLKDNQCQLLVQDNGTGIPPPIQPRIFEPFYTTKADGTGLGLSLTKQIIIEHGGSIEVSESSSSGTTIAIQLPPAHSHNHTPAADLR